MKTPLRYPGGKSRAVETIMPYILDLDCGELCSPFLGGGSIELKCAEAGMTVHAYDLFQPLVWFWEALLSNPKKLYKHVDAYRQDVDSYTSDLVFREKWCKKCSGKCLIKLDSGELCNHHQKLSLISKGKILGVSKRNFEICRDLANNREKVTSQKKLFEAAAQYYIVNRTSFSGATTSGGWSWKASWARLTQTTLDRLREFESPNLTVTRSDFRDSLAAHPDAGLYLDPPYCLNKGPKESPVNKETLYGSEGDHHAGFDHEVLASLLKQRSKWVLSYNDCEYIRELYDGYAITNVAWSYGMKNVNSEKMGESSEIIIVG